MKKPTWLRLLAVLLAFGLIAAACGDDDDTASEDTSTEAAEDEATEEEAAAEDEATEEEAAAEDEATEEEAAEEEAAAEDEATEEEAAEEEAAAAVSLAGVCPDPLVIQSDWFPESEHGAIYELIGDDYEVNADQKSVAGSMVLGGEDLGIGVEVRAGGPAIGDQAVAVVMATDDDITLGYGSTDGQVLRYDKAPLLSVLAPLEKNPQIVMWDPEGIPGAETIADLGELGTTIRVFGPATWQDVLAGLGILSADQIDPSYDGSPAIFIAEGDVAQQGFASAEPYEYEFNIEEYGREVGFQLLSDAGFEVYSQTIAIRPEQQEELDACLKAVVPIIQQSTVNFYAAPDRANAIIIDAVEKYDTFWSYEPGLAAYSVQSQLDLGLAGNGPDSTVGNMDMDRLQRVIDSMRTANLDFPDDLTPEDLATNEYIDESIGF